MEKRILRIITFLYILLISVIISNQTIIAEESQEEWIIIAFDKSEDAPIEDRIYIKIHPGETVKFPEVPEDVDGMKLSGWYATYEDKSDEVVDESTKFYKDALIRPIYMFVLSPSDAELVFRKTCYSVKFIDPKDEEEPYGIIYVDLDEKKDLYTLIDDNSYSEIKRDGYTFLGWYTEPEGGDLIAPGLLVTSDMTLYAHWKKDDGLYRLLYYENYNHNGSGLYKIEWCKKIPKLPKLKREGYLFEGWHYYSYDNKKLFVVKKGQKLETSTSIYADWIKVVVGKASIKNIKKASKNKVSLSIKKVKNADGYQIVMCKNKKFDNKDNKVYTTKKTTKTIKLKKNTKYIRVRAYRYDSLGSKVYGKWSKVRKI